MALEAVVETVELDRPQLAAVALYDVKPYPFPLKPIKPAACSPRMAEQFWDRVYSHKYMLADHVRQQKDAFVQGMLSGAIKWFDFGDKTGFVHVSNVENGIADVNFEIVGNKRAFAKRFGPVNDCLKISLRAIFRWLGLRKLRAFIVEENAPSWRMAERAGFKLEGTLRNEWIIAGQPRVVRLYGLLAEEV